MITAQVVSGALDFEQLERRVYEGDCVLQFLERAERIARSMDEKNRCSQIGKVRSAELRGLAGRMQRIGEQQKAVGEAGGIRCQHAGLAPAVRVPAEPDLLG